MELFLPQLSKIVVASVVIKKGNHSDYITEQYLESTLASKNNLISYYMW